MRTSAQRKSETCNEQLERMVKSYALDITEGKPGTAYEYMEDVYDIEWITNQDHTYKAARLLVAGGGPNIWVNLRTNTVDGYWGSHKASCCGSDKVSWGFVDNIGLDEYLQEIHSDR